MTEQLPPTNPLMARPRLAHSRPAFVAVNDDQVPTDIHDYCGWLNAKERRRGLWVVANKDGVKAIDWKEEIATDDWLRENGLVPKIGRRA